MRLLGRLRDDPATTTVDFNVAQAGADNALSLCKLLRLGYKFDLDLEKHLLMKKGGKTVKLFLDGNSLRVRTATFATTQEMFSAKRQHCVAMVADTEMESAEPKFE